MTSNNIISAVGRFYLTAHNGHYTYGDSKSLPPCDDHITSCDRGAMARPLWDLGLRDQKAGGETVITMEPWLLKHGFKKITDQNALKAGDIVLFRNASMVPNACWHTFILTSFTSVAKVSKYDFGSQSRIDSVQPFVNVPLNQWPGVRWFYCAFRWEGGDAPDDSVDYAFDANYYRTAHPDVVKACGDTEDSLRRHYDTFGRKEGRAANCVLTPSFYKNKYKDLQKAFGSDWAKYIDHWSEYGVKEGRLGSVVFDWMFYRKTYPDLRKAFGNTKWKYYRHFIQNGMKEGRKGSARFDPKVYRKRYKDLDKAFGNNWKMYYIHYLVYGIKEKRKGN